MSQGPNFSFTNYSIFRMPRPRPRRQILAPRRRPSVTLKMNFRLTGRSSPSSSRNCWNSPGNNNQGNGYCFTTLNSLGTTHQENTLMHNKAVWGKNKKQLQNILWIMTWFVKQQFVLWVKHCLYVSVTFSDNSSFRCINVITSNYTILHRFCLLKLILINSMHITSFFLVSAEVQSL